MGLISFLAKVISVGCDIYIFIIFVRCLASWINLNPYGKVYRFVFELTEPLMAPIRRLMPRTGMVDFSPMILMVLVIILERVLLMLLSLLV